MFSGIHPVRASTAYFGAVVACPPADNRRDVVLIGGSASAGKSTAATALARELGVKPVVHVDDIRRDYPEAVHHLGIPGVWGYPAARLLELLLDETASVHKAVSYVVEQAWQGGTGAIVEGEGVEPALFKGLDPRVVARPVYVIETDPAVLRQTFASRPSATKFLRLPPEHQVAVVEMNRLYATWLRQEADKSGQAWVPSQPWASLPERIAQTASIQGPGYPATG